MKRRANELYEAYKQRRRIDKEAKERHMRGRVVYDANSLHLQGREMVKRGQARSKKKIYKEAIKKMDHLRNGKSK